MCIIHLQRYALENVPICMVAAAIPRWKTASSDESAPCNRELRRVSVLSRIHRSITDVADARVTRPRLPRADRRAHFLPSRSALCRHLSELARTEADGLIREETDFQTSRLNPVSATPWSDSPRVCRLHAGTGLNRSLN
jgi:hypothetical protein